MQTILNKLDAPEECQIEDGGPAFPLLYISLRDHYAGQAMKSLIASHGLSFDTQFIHKFTDAAYEYADGMLKARLKARG